MIPSNISSNESNSYIAKLLPPRMNKLCKASSDRHLKVDGKDRRIRLSKGCAERVFELNKRLGHRSAGQTVEWLLNQARASVDAVLNTNPSGDKMASSISSSKYGHETDVDISADNVVKFLFGHHDKHDLEEKQQNEKE